jgi:hypothetical protein
MAALNQLELFNWSLPQKIQCASNLPSKHDSSYCDNKVRYKKDAIKHLYLRPNTFNSISWLIFDIDRPTSVHELTDDMGAPDPTLFVQNPKNHHAHVLYYVDTAVHKNKHSSQKALRFLKAVENGLIDKLQSDVGFNGSLGKNPLNSHWKVQDTYGVAYDLQNLSEYVDLNAANISDTDIGKNVTIFQDVSKWAYKAIRQGYPRYEQWYNAVLSRVEMLNAQYKKDPLPYSEYKHIAKSIATWTDRRFSKQGFSEWQSNNGKLSGIARANKSKDNRIKAIEMSVRGMTQQAIADYFKVTRMTINRWLKHGV